MATTTQLNLNQTFSNFQNLKVQRREKRLGGAANVALNIQALGTTPLLCALSGAEYTSCHTRFLSNLGRDLVCESVGVVPVNKQKLMEEAAKYL